MENTNLPEDMKIANLNDCWLKMYVYLAKEITDGYGIEGEAALRRGIRNFGYDRGETLRKEQLALGMKINMYNLWTYYDLPGDPRFKRNKIRLNTRERISETLVCPMADMWISMGAKDLGAIYCDEFHPAMFSGYHPKMVTNLGETLTHDTDDHCHFALYLMPANMTEEERKMSFPEYDPEYDEKKAGQYVVRPAREGYNMLTIKLYYHIAAEAIKAFGEDGRNTVAVSLNKWAEDISAFLRIRADAAGRNPDAGFIRENCPVSMDIEEDTLWKQYESNGIKDLFEKNFYGPFLASTDI